MTLRKICLRMSYMAAWSVILAPLPAQALSPGVITTADLSLAPPVCMDVQAIDATGWVQGYRESPRSGYWKSLLGDTFWAMHHYCWAIVRLNRMGGKALTPTQRAFEYDSAVSDFQYVLNNAKPNFVLLPEIYWRMGDAHFKKGDIGAALTYFTYSREAKGDYWPAFAGLADVMRKAGKREDAIALLREGLEKAPGTAALQERLAELMADESRGKATSAKDRSAGSNSAGK